MGEGKKSGGALKVILIIVGVLIVGFILIGLFSGDGEYDDYSSDSGSDYSTGSSTGSSSGSGNYMYGGNLGFGSLGSADTLSGTTLIVSVFADDTKTSWTDADAAFMYESLDSLKVATDWLTSSAAKYGSSAKFVYDWQQNEDLYNKTSFSIDLTDENAVDYPVWEYIDSSIDTATLKSKYNADNVIYLMYVNTPLSNTITSCARNYYEGMEYPYEVVYLYMGCEGYKENAAAFAHEMLHTFGAPDLYRVDTDGSNYGTTQAMLDYMESIPSNDIMFTTYDQYTQEPHYDTITNEFSDAVAYYVGIADSSEFVSTWGLAASQHE